jgi:hypothetical protein
VAIGTHEEDRQTFTRPVSTGYKVTAVFPGNAQYPKKSKSMTLP